MPSIAQQDYYVIEIEDYEYPTSKDRAKIKEKVEQGIILDCVIKTEYAGADMCLKVLGYSKKSYVVFIIDPDTDEITGFNYGELG